MKKNKGVSALLVVALLIGAVLMPIISAQKAVNEDKKKLLVALGLRVLMT